MVTAMANSVPPPQKTQLTRYHGDSYNIFGTILQKSDTSLLKSLSFQRIPDNADNSYKKAIENSMDKSLFDEVGAIRTVDIVSMRNTFSSIFLPSFKI